MVDQLQKEYAGKPVLFVEQQVGTGKPTVNNRDGNFWIAFGKNSATTPMSVIDSGFEIGTGSEDFHKVYKAKVDKELKRPAGADIKVLYERDGTGAVNARLDVTNHTDKTLSLSNQTKVQVLVFEDIKLHDTSRFVRAGAMMFIPEDLAPGKSASFKLTVAPDKLREVADLNKMRVLGFIEYRPGGNTGAFDMLNAALGEQGPLTAPTAVPPTAVPPTEEPTDVPPTEEATPTAEAPTAVPPTAEPPAPEKKWIYLPICSMN